MWQNLSDSTVAEFRITRPSSPRPSFIELDEDELLVNQPPLEISPVTPVYSNPIISHFDAKCRGVGRHTQTRTLKQSQSSDRSPVMKNSVPKCHGTLDNMMDVPILAGKDVEAKERDHEMKVADVMERVTSSELGPHVIEATKKLQVSKYPLCTFKDNYFQELLEERVLTHGESLSDSVGLGLSDPPYRALSSH